MSGGSYNYLCNAWDLPDLIEHRTELKEMADRLTDLGHVDAAKETAALLLEINRAEVWALARAERLSEVWRAVEWHDSSDWGADAIDKALDKYRGAEEATA
jgi:hypothetical protein